MVRHFKLPEEFLTHRLPPSEDPLPLHHARPANKVPRVLAQEGKKYPNFRLQLVANVAELIEEHGQVCGVRYQSTDGWHTMRALLRWERRTLFQSSPARGFRADQDFTTDGHLVV